MEKIDIGVLVAALMAMYSGKRVSSLLDYLVLLVLRDGELLSLQAVARRLHMRDKQVWYSLERLEDHGLARRIYSDGVWWRLTRDGLTELRKIYRMMSEEVQENGS